MDDSDEQTNQKLVITFLKIETDDLKSRRIAVFVNPYSVAEGIWKSDLQRRMDIRLPQLTQATFTQTYMHKNSFNSMIYDHNVVIFYHSFPQ